MQPDGVGRIRVPVGTFAEELLFAKKVSNKFNALTL